MDGVVEIITGRERRRRWSMDFKLRVVAETQEPGAQVRVVAARHGVCENLVFTWRRQVRDGVLTAPEMPMFMPVQMLETPTSTVGPVHSERASAPTSIATLCANDDETLTLCKFRLGRRRTASWLRPTFIPI